MTEMNLTAQEGDLLPANRMAHVWSALFTTLTFLSWASSEQVVLMQEPGCSSCVWSWRTYRFTCNTCLFSGWDQPGIPGLTRTNRYSVCNVMLPYLNTSYTEQPNNWLRSDLIDVGEVQRVDVIIKYFIRKCPDSALFCKEFFDVYVWESNTSVASHQIPDPLNSNSSYRRFANITLQSNNQTTSIIPLVVTSKYIVLGFRDQGGCRTLYSVKVTYNACPQETLSESLVSVPQTLAPISESLPVKGNCTAGSVPVQGSLHVLCESSGKWNTSLLKGRCICKEDMENTGGKCEDCKIGEYNNQRGLNCTVLPAHPSNVKVSFVNQSSAMITWKPPVITGGEVFYEVDCQKTCKDCDEKTCGGEAGLVSHKKSSVTTHVTITNLSPFVNYTCKIMAKNRVSEMAARNHLVYANATIIKLKTQGSVPGTPVVVVQQADYAFTELSWQLKCKNGIIKKYHVTYYREDDSSDKETLATNEKETKVRIEKLAPGKTFVFQVVAENNLGRGPAGVKTFKIPSDGSNKNMVIYIVVVYTALGVVLFIVLALIGLYVYRQRKSQNILPQSVDRSQAFEGSINASEIEELNMDVIEERNIDDVKNHAQYMEISDIPSFEMERDDIEFVRLLGSGNFGEVFKATVGHVTVAVKSLKETATAKDKMDMVTELNVMKRLKPHPHVLKLIGCCSNSDPLLIVLEYLPYGDLLGYLRKSRGHSDSYHSGEKKPTSKLTAKDLLSFAWMIADGMNYLAKMKIVHRDLAARNILVGENKVCKISDFGLARDVNADIYVRASQARLPVKWMPPESLFRGESSTMSDVWSYGIVLWEVFTIGDSPYPGVKAREVASLLERGYRMSRPIHISKELFSIFSECWCEKPEDRPTFQWICAAVKRLIDDQQTYVNLDVYNDKDYVNFDMVDEQQ